MSVRRKRDDSTAAFPRADQSVVDGAVVVGHEVAKGTDPASPDEVVAPATRGRPPAGQGDSPGGADAAASAGGPTYETPALLAAALEASEERLRTALDTMLDGVTVQSAVRDASGRITDFRFDYSNPAVSVISGLGRAERVGHTLLELFPAHRTNGLFDAYVRVVETGLPFASDDFQHVDPDAAGGPLDQVVDVRAAKLGDGYVLSVRDMTLHNRADLEMRRLAAAINQTADAVVITDTTGAIEYVNPAFEQVTGYSSRAHRASGATGPNRRTTWLEPPRCWVC
jgi:PAS domain-containing protein